LISPVGPRKGNNDNDNEAEAEDEEASAAADVRSAASSSLLEEEDPPPPRLHTTPSRDESATAADATAEALSTSFVVASSHGSLFDAASSRLDCEGDGN
jgi:hypothetical protein